MRTQKTEEILDSFIDFVNSNLSAELTQKTTDNATADNTRYGESIPLPMFDKIYHGDRVRYSKSFNQVMFVAVDERIPQTDDRLWRRDNLVITCIISISSQRDVDYVEDWLNRKIERYAECLSQLIAKNPTIAKKLRDVGETSQDFDPISQSGEYIFKACYIKFSAFAIFAG